MKQKLNGEKKLIISQQKSMQQETEYQYTMNEIKSWFSYNISKIEKHLASPIKKKKKEDTNYQYQE